MLQANSTGALVPGTCSEEPGRRSPEWAPISAGPAACRRKASGRSASARGPQDVVVRYNGTAWVSASRYLAHRNLPLLAHLNGTRWSRVQLPWRVDPGAMAPDGRGGL